MALFPAYKLCWYSCVVLQDVSFMSCASHKDMVVALDYPKLLLLNCFDLFFDHSVIFDFGKHLRLISRLEIHFGGMYCNPRAVRLSCACVLVTLRSKFFSSSGLVSLAVCLFYIHSNILQLIHWPLVKFLS